MSSKTEILLEKIWNELRNPEFSSGQVSPGAPRFNLQSFGFKQYDFTPPEFTLIKADQQIALFHYADAGIPVTDFIEVTAEILVPSTGIHRIRQQYALAGVTSPGTDVLFYAPNEDCYLLNLQIKPVNGTNIYTGRVFVRVGIVTNSGGGLAMAAETYLQTLVSGYVSETIHPSYPASEPKSGTELTHGAIQELTTAPGAGANWDYELLAHERFRILSIRARLVCDANAANRVAMLEIAGAANELLLIDDTLGATANQTRIYFWYAGHIAPHNTGNRNWISDLPVNLEIQGNWHIRSNTTNIQAGDQWSQIRIVVESFVDPDGN